MKTSDSRRVALKKMAGGAVLTGVGLALANRIQAAEAALDPTLKGRINHSVCRWCYSQISLDDLCKAAKDMGIASIDLVGPTEWPTLKKYGLVSAMTNGAGKGIVQGFNNPVYHDELVKSYEEVIPQVAEAGYSQLICFSGNRNGMSDEKGLENCAIGLKRLMSTAEKHKVTVVMELLNSKVNHKDYMADHTAWG
ncbi:MAG: sugar phosphate isomerase/epimerase, partial [Cytophagaceae bacterium]|nr:sugar phosphate isomerase/epimerase [Cytophagaceae bacterium]